MKGDLTEKLFLANLRNKSLKSCDYFSENILGFKNEEFHSEIYSLIQDEENKQILLLCPRSHGKSTCVSINFSLWNLIGNSDVRIILASEVISQSSSFLRETTGIIENHKLFKSVFGNLKPPLSKLEKWTDTEIIIRNRTKIFKDPTISCVGTGGAVLSKRADLIVCDDIISPENSGSNFQRKKVKEWFFRVLLPCLEPNGKLVVIGTRFNVFDLYSDLLEDKSFQVRKVYKAINIDVLDEETALWESRWNLEKLKEKKIQMGSLLFNQQYLNLPISDEDSMFRSDWVKNYNSNELDISQLDCFGAIDPAISQKESADYSAIVIIGVDKEGKIYVLSARHGHWSPTELINEVLSEYKFYKQRAKSFNAFGFEVVAFQKVLKNELDRISKEQRIYVPSVEVAPDRDKIRRIMVLIPFFENGVISLKENLNDLKNELLGFPKNIKNDDLVDSLTYAVGLIQQKSQIRLTIIGDDDKEEEILVPPPSEKIVLGHLKRRRY